MSVNIGAKRNVLSGVSKDVLVSSPSPAATYISGLRINCPAAAGVTWIGILEILVYDVDGLEEFSSAGLTAMGEAYTTYESLSNGQFTSDSTYGVDLSVANIANGLPDKNDPASTVGGFEWNTTSGVDLNIFIKFYAPIKWGNGAKVEMAAYVYSVYGEWHNQVTFRDENNNLLPLVTAPSGRLDYFQTTGDTYTKWFRYTF